MMEYDQKITGLFMNLILTFQMAAWQQLGKVQNPISEKIEKNLEQAQFSIDMLEMIRKKTEGNLTDPEKQMLNKVISELELNYITEVDKEKKVKEEKSAKTETKETVQKNSAKMKKSKEKRES